MRNAIRWTARWIFGDGWLRQSVRDLMPTVIVIAIFQVFVFRQPLDNVGELLVGFALIVIGLSLFTAGLEKGLFPLGEQMAHDFAVKGSVMWLMAFALALGAGTFAEPGLIAVTTEVAELRAVAGAIEPDEVGACARGLRVTVSAAVGTALAVGVLRIILGWPAHYLILPAYVLLVVLTPLAPPMMAGLAYDVGPVAMSTVTVPLTAALGIGLASSIKGRSTLTDAFGVIALAALLPNLAVMLQSILWP